jgi:hypothetical protein
MGELAVIHVPQLAQFRFAPGALLCRAFSAVHTPGLRAATPGRRTVQVLTDSANVKDEPG